MADDGSEYSHENEKQRVDRELIELLNEVRVALPGVQLLFGFLLALPFQQRFAAVSGFDRNVYFVALSLTLLSTVLLITPSAYHRFNFRIANKAHIVFFSHRMMLAGLLALGCAMTSVMLLIADVMFDLGPAIVVAALTAATFLLFWLILPLRERREATDGD